MITLSGVYGKGTLLGTFYLPDREASGKGYCVNNHLDYNIPPSDWYLPPPDSVWYSVEKTAYGPHSAALLVGDIQSVNDNASEWNPCKHSTMRGDALYLGPGGINAPYWRKMVSNPISSFTACNDDYQFPALSGKFLSLLRGRPCNATDKAVFDRYGNRVNLVLSTDYGGDRYWNIDSIINANLAPPAIQSALLQVGPLHKTGQWYARSVSGALVTSPVNNTYFYRIGWRRPSRTTFVRDLQVEYHSLASYTPAASIAWTGYGNVVEANHRITTCNITHVRSDSPGRFQVKYDLTTELDWFGWIPWSYYSGEKVVTTTGLTASILILEPGLTPEVTLVLDSANNYCHHAKKRARLLYDAKSACSARTQAVRDVQELDSNWLENLAGVKGAMSCIRPLLDGYKAIKNGDLVAARRALSGAYLVYKYVVAPGIADAKNIKTDSKRILSLATTNRFSLERRRGISTRVDVPVCGTKALLTFTTTYHLQLKSNYFSQIWAGLEKFGIDPSSGQIWDLIPFSFVVDWFISVGDSLRNIDAYNSLVLNRNLRARIESFKAQWPVEKEVIKSLFDGNVCSSGTPLEYSWYDRRIHQTVGEVDPIKISDGNGLTVSQMTQGAALLSQMMR